MGCDRPKRPKSVPDASLAESPPVAELPAAEHPHPHRQRYDGYS